MASALDTLNIQEIREKARVDAASVLDLYWDEDRLPVDPVQVARQLGVSVFSAELGEDTIGMLVANKGGADIYLDKDQPASRFRFTCAHEVGHYVDRSSALDPEEACIDRRSDAGRGSPSEVYANEFAGSLLMPEDDLRRAIAAGQDDFELARRYAVSLDALRYRRQLLGLRT